MDLFRPTLSSEITSATQSSVWMKTVEFKKADALQSGIAAMSMKKKYNLLRADGLVGNGFAPKSAVSHTAKNNNTSTWKSERLVNGCHQKDVVSDDIPAPKIRIEAPDDLILTWRKMSSIGAGLVNLGNTCFMNSVLQCLTYCPPLVNYLMYRETDHSKKLCTNFCMACQLLNHMKRCFETPGGVVKPVAIAQRLKSVAKHFQLGRQEDAHEYLRHAIDSMCKSSVSAYESKNPPVKLDSASKETTAFNHIFGGYLRSQVTCLECKSRSNTYDHFMDFMLDIKNVLTIEKALERFTKPEHLQNENAYKCPKCKKKAPATKRFSVHRPPNVVTIQLKRFEFHRFTGGKITKHIQYPEFLNLRPYMSDTSGENLMFRLNAVLVHFGSSCNSGHYYCYVRNSNNSWFRMDDEKVSSAGLHQVLNQNAYILFYIKKAASGDPKSLANCSVAAHNPAVLRADSSVPEVRTAVSNNFKVSGSLPRPFAESTLTNKSSLMTRVNNIAIIPKGPKLIVESANCSKKIMMKTANGMTSHPKTPFTVNCDKKQLSNSSTRKNLVPYSSDSSSEDEQVITTKNGSNGLKACSTTEPVKSFILNGARNSPSSDSVTPIKTGVVEAANGVQKTSNFGLDLMRLESQTLQSFGSSVTGWDGGQNQLDKRLEQDKRSAAGMDEGDMYDQEYDRGKTKKVKTAKTEGLTHHLNGKNPFDLWRQNRSKPDAGPQSSFLDRDTSCHWRGKQRFAGRGGGHNRKQQKIWKHKRQEYR